MPQLLLELQTLAGFAQGLDAGKLLYGLILHERSVARGTDTQETMAFLPFIDANGLWMASPGVAQNLGRMAEERGDETPLDLRLVRASALRLTVDEAKPFGRPTLQRAFLAVLARDTRISPKMGLTLHVHEGHATRTFACTDNGAPPLLIWSAPEWADEQSIPAPGVAGDLQGYLDQMQAMANKVLADREAALDRVREDERDAERARESDALRRQQLDLEREEAQVRQRAQAAAALARARNDAAAAAAAASQAKAPSPATQPGPAPVVAKSSPVPRVAIVVMGLGAFLWWVNKKTPPEEAPAPAPAPASAMAPAPRPATAPSPPFKPTERMAQAPAPAPTPMPMPMPMPMPTPTPTPAPTPAAAAADAAAAAATPDPAKAEPSMPQGLPQVPREALYALGFEDHLRSVNRLLAAAKVANTTEFDKEVQWLRENQKNPEWSTSERQARIEFNRWMETTINTAKAADDKARLQKAVSLSEQFVQSHFGLATGHMNLSIALSALDRGKEAVAPAFHTVVFDPRGANSYVTLALALGRKGDLENAAAAFCAALRRSRYSDKTVTYFSKVAAGEDLNYPGVAAAMRRTDTMCSRDKWSVDFPAS